MVYVIMTFICLRYEETSGLKLLVVIPRYNIYTPLRNGHRSRVKPIRGILRDQ